MIDKNKQKEYFEGLLAKYGSNHLALDWNSKESQTVRFGVLSDILVYGKRSHNISILDVGCGLGDLFGYLNQKQLLERHKITYLGYDISDKLIEAARQKYPDGSFECKDILEEKSLARFDYVFCSGVFNMRTSDTETHYNFVREMLQRMYDIALHGVAINFLSEEGIPLSDPKELNSGRYFMYKPEDVIKMCRAICGYYILRHDYFLRDFAVYLLK